MAAGNGKAPKLPTTPKLVSGQLRHPKTGRFIKGIGTPQAIPTNLISTMPGGSK